MNRTTHSEADYINQYLGYEIIEDLSCYSRKKYNHVYMRKGEDLYNTIYNYITITKFIKKCMGNNHQNIVHALRKREMYSI